MEALHVKHIIIYYLFEVTIGSDCLHGRKRGEGIERRKDWGYLVVLVRQFVPNIEGPLTLLS